MLTNKFKVLTAVNTRSLLLPGVVVILIILSGLAFVRPKVNRNLQLKQETKVEEQTLAQLTAKLASLSSLDQNELSKMAKVLTKTLPTEQNVPLNFSVFKILAKKNNIEISGLSISPAGPVSTSGETVGNEANLLSYNLALEGKIEDAKEFMSQVRRTVPLMVTKSGTLENDLTSGTLKASFLVDSYYLFLPVSLGAVENPLIAISPQEDQIYQEINQLETVFEPSELIPIPGGKENPFSF